ncbi:MAG: RES family NAD+ phosphorylase [Proteobacteria bacterium]|nr:RES family NAD+ phosphorylase [Pseudomonadota bacterium]MBI3499239.1 RES family NAD+ phosphorylase [Pseudomonadota bacterium]
MRQGPRRKVRDNVLYDAIEASKAERFDDDIWRAVRADRDPLRGSSSGGRWDDGTFEVLYASLEADGALAEMYFHLMRGQPVFPSRMQFCLYKLRAKLRRALRLSDLGKLATLGVDITKYGSLEYLRRHDEYSRTQEIAEIAHFLDFDGVIVPSARWKCRNLVLFTDRVPPDALNVAEKLHPIDWAQWKSRTQAS